MITIPPRNACTKWPLGAMPLVFMLVASCMSSLPAVAATYAPYGLIEIGAKGVKAYTFDIDHAEKDAACAAEGEAFLKCINPQSLAQVNCNPVSDPGFKCTIPAVKEFTASFKSKYSIPAEHIYIVGSSSLSGKELKRDQLTGQIDELVKPTHPLDFVTVDQEAAFNLKGVLGLLPDNVRAKRVEQAVVIDVGSGNTKGGYKSMSGGTERIVVFGVDTGAKVAADAINTSRSNVEFAVAADKWRSTELVPMLRTEIENKDGVGNRDRVYLTGGIVWAMVNFSHPENKDRYVRIMPGTFDEMLSKAKAADSAARFCSDAQTVKYPQVKEACDTFSPDQRVAGLEILKALADELHFVSAKKTIFFFRDAQSAWPLGYIRNKLYPNKTF